MLVRDEYPPGVPCWIDLAQPDPEAAMRFYGGVFGWGFDERAPERYWVATLGGHAVAGIGAQPDDADTPPVWSTYIRVDGADATAAAVADAGGTVLAPPFDVADAGRAAACADPTGAAVWLWQPGRRRGAQVVNAPGTWNWSTLETRDLEAAKAFYAAVFGWECETIDMGGEEGTMCRVPGYGDHLAALDPEIRERHDEPWVPAGFSDAVAWMAPMTDDRFPEEAPSHWSVTFAVDDADAVAARAAELGGEVVVGPFDADVVRIAVLSDPSGAVFTVSRFAPPD